VIKFIWLPRWISRRLALDTQCNDIKTAMHTKQITVSRNSQVTFNNNENYQSTLILSLLQKNPIDNHEYFSLGLYFEKICSYWRKTMTNLFGNYFSNSIKMFLKKMKCRLWLWAFIFFRYLCSPTNTLSDNFIENFSISH
jgi:hypothetical protein